jgi:hypothetical protein
MSLFPSAVPSAYIADTFVGEYYHIDRQIRPSSCLFNSFGAHLPNAPITDMHPFPDIQNYGPVR